jgi:hypothetical protein
MYKILQSYRIIGRRYVDYKTDLGEIGDWKSKLNPIN